jgi:hypothetical protein
VKGGSLDGARRWLADPDNAVFVILLGVSLVPLLALTHFPTQDGPSHVHNAGVIAEYWRPDRSAFREYYVLNMNLQPNLLGHLILAALITVVPPPVAERLLLAGYVVFFTLVARYALRAFGSESRSVALLAFPMVYGFAVHMGFYNYALSLPLYLLVLGYWAAHRDRFAPRHAVILGGLLFLLYTAHLLTLGLAFLSLAILAGGTRLGGLMGGEPNRSAEPPQGVPILLPLLASMPVLYLTASYFAASGFDAAAVPGPREIAQRFFLLLFFGGVVSLSPWEIGVMVALASLIGGLCLFALVRKVRRRTAWRGADMLLPVLAALALFYLLVPARAAGGSYVAERMGVMIYLIALLWLGAQAPGVTASRVARWAAVCLTVGILAVRVPAYAELDRLMREYQAAGPQVEPNTTLLSVSFDHRGHDERGDRISFLTGPFLHAAGYIGAERGVVVVNNYEASLPYFPVRFRAGRDPSGHMGPQDARGVPRLDLRGYASLSGAPVDYVLLWGETRVEPNAPAYRSLLQTLEEDYQLLYQSPAPPRLRLFRHAAGFASQDPP